ncbi:hypothetical protein DFH09DRAFT_1306985 [Mycena vulgaris]|nr:hypothetical protein DFH09DRAFT_1306985 [Mycena vulgaris]
MPDAATQTDDVQVNEIEREFKREAIAYVEGNSTHPPSADMLRWLTNSCAPMPLPTPFGDMSEEEERQFTAMREASVAHLMCLHEEGRERREKMKAVGLEKWLEEAYGARQQLANLFVNGLDLMPPLLQQAADLVQEVGRRAGWDSPTLARSFGFYLTSGTTLKMTPSLAATSVRRKRKASDLLDAGRRTLVPPQSITILDPGMHGERPEHRWVLPTYDIPQPAPWDPTAWNSAMGELIPVKCAEALEDASNVSMEAGAEEYPWTDYIVCDRTDPDEAQALWECVNRQLEYLATTMSFRGTTYLDSCNAKPIERTWAATNPNPMAISMKGMGSVKRQSTLDDEVCGPWMKSRMLEQSKSRDTKETEDEEIDDSAHAMGM